MTTSTYKGAYLPVVSGDAGTWGTLLNTDTFPVFDKNLGGIVTKSLSNANVTLSSAESQNAILRLTGTLSANVQITTVAQGFTLIQNATTGNYLVTFTNGTGNVVIAAQGISTMVHIDATNGCFLSGRTRSTVGDIVQVIGTTLKSGLLKCNGALVSRATYPELWAYAQASGNIVTNANWDPQKAFGCFSSGDGSTNFRLPDLRECFTMGWADDKTGGVDDGRAAGIFQDQELLGHGHTASSGNDTPDHTHSTYGVNVGGGGAGGNYLATYTTSTGGASTRHQHPITVNASSANTRNVPNNVALMYCISYV